MLRKMLFMFMLVVFSFTNVFSHDQLIHQYITREAFKLLKKSFPNELSEMESYIGTSEIWSNTSADGSFGALKIVSGAYLEDEYDAVYGYGLVQQPTYNQAIPVNTIVNLFGSLREAHTTITHFWDADNGENANTFLNDNSDLGYWSFTIPENAMSKMRKYVNGYYEFIWAYKNGYTAWPWCGISSTQFMTKFDTPDIISFYNDEEVFEANSYLAVDHQWYQTSCPSWGIGNTLFKKAHAYEILGRMCHLLQDMSIPAHVHTTSHAGTMGMYSDLYENSVSSFSLHTADAIWANGEQFLDPYVNYEDPIYYLMYYINQITDHYADGKKDGDNNFDSNAPGISDIIQNSNWQNMRYSSQVNLNNCSSMHDVIFPQVIRATAGLMYWFAVEAGLLPPKPYVVVYPTTKNVGSVKVDTPISGSFQLVNTGNVTLNLKIQTTNYGFDLDPSTQTWDYILYRTLSPGSSTTINYSGTMLGSTDYGPFTETITIDDNANSIHKTHSIIGTLMLPDFCYGETSAKAASPEELLFDKEFNDFFAGNNDSLSLNKDQSLKERLSFAYNLLNQPSTVSEEEICKMIIELYPESEMGVSFYAMGLLWEASLSEEIKDFDEQDFKKYLEELTKSKEKYKINGHAQLILSLMDVGNDLEGLEKLYSDYQYDILKELSLFHQFIHFYIYQNDEETARKLSDFLDKIYVDSKYGYQAHLILGDEGYSLKGLQELLETKQNSLLAKRGENKSEIISEMPTEYELYINYPNPFNPTTTIKFSVPENGNVKLKVYNMMGQLVKTLVNDNKAPGFYSVEWNGTNENNLKVASGIYFYRFECREFIANKKMIMLK